MISFDRFVFGRQAQPVGEAVHIGETELLCVSATLSLSVASVTCAIAACESGYRSNAKKKIRLRGNSFIVIIV
jgi:hypothetical protein